MPAEEMELKTLIGQLADPARDSKTKIEAAELLLSRSYPEAAKVLRGFLEDSSNRQAQVAVADAITLHGGGPIFIEPLTAMLTGREDSVRAPAGRALATYKDHGVTKKLIAIACDRWHERAVRLVTIESLHRILDKRVVDALVRLLDDPDRVVQNTSCQALAKLTNIRAFGVDRMRWKRWWQRNKNKDRSEWLADLADNLARAKAGLETDNIRLRDRLAQAMRDLYAATPADQREAMVITFLKDPLADVRLVGAKLADRMIAGGDEIPAEMRKQIVAMLRDGNASVRSQAALLVANLGYAEAAVELLGRLKVEKSPEVRAELLRALGQLHDPLALPSVLAEIESDSEIVAAAAAAALSRIAAAQPLDDDQHDSAVKALLGRYARAGQVAEPDPVAALREALLTAMGVVGDKDFIAALEGAAKKPSATVRLAAVNALARIGQARSAAIIRPLVADPDRGVRQAAIAALGTLDGQEHLQSILQRTDPAMERDAAVRQQAWDVAMDVLAKADAGTLGSVADSLADRADADAQRIKVLQMLVELLKTEKSADLPARQQALGRALVKAGRPAEAAPYLAEAHKLLAAAKSIRADRAWIEWIDALLAAADPAAVKAMADENVTDELFVEALKRLNARLKVLAGELKFSPVILLAQAAIDQLSQRLTVRHRTELEKLLAHSRSEQAAADRRKVAGLVGQLLGAEESARDAAEKQLQAMSDRAVVPLLEEMKKLLADEEKPDADTEKAEKAILALLSQLAPNLTGYDPASARADRIKQIETWLKGQ
ncbi:MAG: HEAT repeat domain-containing protein [Planctomycetota bacterium]|nr:HEAT repeat domain-containing protein [Planctomycetota bacterium]